MSNNETSSPPTPSIDASSISNQNQKSRLEILSSSTGYVSLLETSENPGEFTRKIPSFCFSFIEF